MKATPIREFLFEAVGWYAAAAVLLVYSMASFGILSAQSLAFQLLNLTGGLAFVVLGLHRKVYAVVTLNAVWAVVALIGLFRA